MPGDAQESASSNYRKSGTRQCHSCCRKSGGGVSFG